VADDFSTAPTPAAGSPVVSSSRRQTGTVIAIVLLVALVATAIWFVVQTAQKVAPGADSTRSDSAHPAQAPTPKG
jgi:hypothetical protein